MHVVELPYVEFVQFQLVQFEQLRRVFVQLNGRPAPCSEAPPRGDRQVHRPNSRTEWAQIAALRAGPPG
ncbi:hypothetical protein AB3X94_07685 [Paraburkholderia sp. BR10923]|uniref:hypothetical protein n=1 Tax=Paraburkholderia sp. BR10923 TaxID=3236992 RepID=UPI0034CE9B64